MRHFQIFDSMSGNLLEHPCTFLIFLIIGSCYGGSSCIMKKMELGQHLSLQVKKKCSEVLFGF